MAGNAGKGLNIKAENDENSVRKETLTMRREQETDRDQRKFTDHLGSRGRRTVWQRLELTCSLRPQINKLQLILVPGTLQAAPPNLQVLGTMKTAPSF